MTDPNTSYKSKGLHLRTADSDGDVTVEINGYGAGYLDPDEIRDLREWLAAQLEKG